MAFADFSHSGNSLNVMSFKFDIGRRQSPNPKVAKTFIQTGSRRQFHRNWLQTTQSYLDSWMKHRQAEEWLEPTRTLYQRCTFPWLNAGKYLIMQKLRTSNRSEIKTRQLVWGQAPAFMLPLTSAPRVTSHPGNPRTELFGDYEIFLVWRYVQKDCRAETIHVSNVESAYSQPQQQ